MYEVTDSANAIGIFNNIGTIGYFLSKYSIILDYYYYYTNVSKKKLNLIIKSFRVGIQKSSYESHQKKVIMMLVTIMVAFLSILRKKKKKKKGDIIDEGNNYF